MPDPPSVGLITKYLFEDAWVLGGLLVGMAAVVGFASLREGRTDRLKAVAVVGLLGVAIFVVGRAVTTAGEHAALLTRQLVDAAVAADVTAALNCFAPDATISFGSPKNPGHGIELIQGALENLDRRYRVQSNRITQLDAYTISRDEARVDLTCFTDVGGGPMPNTWLLRILKQPDGSWKVKQITAIAINRQAPTPGMIR